MSEIFSFDFYGHHYDSVGGVATIYTKMGNFIVTIAHDGPQRPTRVYQAKIEGDDTGRFVNPTLKGLLDGLKHVIKEEDLCP